MNAYRCAALGALVWIALESTGCSFGPIWARRIEGRVTDRSGAPVGGAVVAAHYHAQVFGIIHSTSAEIGYRSAITDSDGRFVLRGRPLVTLCWGCTIDTDPGVRGFHPAYGTRFVAPEHVDSYRDVGLELDADDHHHERIVEEQRLADICHSDLECYDAMSRVYPGAELPTSVEDALGR